MQIRTLLGYQIFININTFVGFVCSIFFIKLKNGLTDPSTPVTQWNGYGWLQFLKIA